MKVKRRRRSVDDAFKTVIDANTHFIGALAVDISFIQDDEQRRITRGLVKTLEEAVAAMFSLRGVYDNMVRCRRIIGRYSWDRRVITRSEYLHLIWLLFINLCYLFEERAKVFGQNFNKVVKAYEIGKPLDTGAFIKRIKRSLNKQIRARGELTHGGLPGHQRIIEYAMFELLHRMRRWPKDWPKHETFHAVAQKTIMREMDAEIRKVKVLMSDLLGDTSIVLAKAIKSFNTAYKKMRVTKRPKLRVSSLT